MRKLIATDDNIYSFYIFSRDEAYNSFPSKLAYSDLPESDLYAPAYGINTDAMVNHIIYQTAWGKYLLSCISTWNTKYPVAFQVSNAVHGIIGELMENYDGLMVGASDEDKISELGDLLYYRTILCYLYGIDLELAPTTVELYRGISLLSDVGKKAAFHDKIDATKTIDRLMHAMGYIDALIVDLLSITELQLDEVMQYNMHKLANRHTQGKFNPNYT